MSSTLNLKEIIKTTINREGPITFARFMDMALYYPELGYYTSNKEKIGREGDYYTSSDVHPLFAHMVARQIAELWNIMGCPPQFMFIEYGAGKGILAREILKELNKQFQECFAALTYWIIEISPSFIEKQKSNLLCLNLPENKVCWVNNPGQVANGEIYGCIFSNELIDAFPVHRVRQDNNSLSEIYVNCRHDELYEMEGPLSKPELNDYFDSQNITLSPGQVAEVNLYALEWLKKQAKYLKQGFIITIDYGLTAELLYSQARYNGTLRCFRKHTLNDNPYLFIGKQDITAHVNFSAMELWGNKMGLHTAGLTSQADFLINMGILEEFNNCNDYRYNEQKLHKTLAIKQLIMPEGMGRYFKVFIQYKGLDNKPELRGLTKRLHY